MSLDENEIRRIIGEVVADEFPDERTTFDEFGKEVLRSALDDRREADAIASHFDLENAMIVLKFVPVLLSFVSWLRRPSEERTKDAMVTALIEEGLDRAQAERIADKLAEQARRS